MKFRGGRVLGLVVASLLLAGCSLGDFLGGNQDAGSTGGPAWDAGNIISDQVFYNDNVYSSPSQIQAALDQVGGSCTAATCLRLATYETLGGISQYCGPYQGGQEKFATILFKLAKACGVNPQVAIVMIQKESQGLTKANPPAALTGFGCPDTGPGGSANCNSAVGGVWWQTFGMFQAIAKIKTKTASELRYGEGKTSSIFWNVEESGCGAGDVVVRNRATATLYTYTPYQPNAAALANPTGTGDACSAYGNRNFFFMFQKYFGPTGGGSGGTAGGGNVLANGVDVTIPNNQYVVEALRGKTVQAPNSGVAAGIAAGLSQLGLPYVWGGGGDGAGPNNGCSRGGGSLNSCGSEIGFDCSGLTAFVLVSGGFGSPGGDSGSQRNGGTDIAWDQGLAGDIVGFSGHVAIYLGVIDGTEYILEASQVGTPIHVVKLTRNDHDSVLHRYWSGSGVA